MDRKGSSPQPHSMTKGKEGVFSQKGGREEEEEEEEKEEGKGKGRGREVGGETENESLLLPV